MTRVLVIVFSFLLGIAPVIADSSFVAPTANGTAAVGQLPGTTTNDDAATGKVGEFVSSGVGAGAPVALTSATPANVTTVSLTAGDWMCAGTVAFSASGTAVVTDEYGAINTTSATQPTLTSGFGSARLIINGAASTAQNNVFAIAPSRVTISGTTTVYLIAQSTFTVSTNNAYGFIGCRRVR